MIGRTTCLNDNYSAEYSRCSGADMVEERVAHMRQLALPVCDAQRAAAIGGGEDGRFA
jgi:hypothetical protein